MIFVFLESPNLIKIDTAGKLQWRLALNSTAYSVVQTGDGGFVLAGSGGGSNNWLIKTSASIDNSSPTPTVPELSWLLIAPLLLFVFSVAVIVRHRRSAYLE